MNVDVLGDEILTTKLKNELKAVVRTKLQSLYCFLHGYFGEYGFFQNINYDPNRQQKRVLLSYITYPFFHDYGEWPGHTSKVEVAVIVKSFIDMDYVVDVIHCENNSELEKVARKQYDCIFGFGEPWRVAVKHNPTAVRVMYLTECAPMFSAKEEQARLDYYARRHGHKLPLVRSCKYFRDEHIKNAQIGGFFGNTYTAKAYINQFPLMKLSLLAPSGFKNKNMNICPPPRRRA